MNVLDDRCVPAPPDDLSGRGRNDVRAEYYVRTKSVRLLDRPSVQEGDRCPPRVTTETHATDVDRLRFVESAGVPIIQSHDPRQYSRCMPDEPVSQDLDTAVRRRIIGAHDEYAW